jgi:hypothetical protein
VLRKSFDEPRFALSLALTNTRAATMVTLDLTDLVLGGWMKADDLPHRDARTRMGAAVAASGSVIVIAEGASDARWLRRRWRSQHPLPRTCSSSLTKGMAAAGVMTRIVAVLDHDIAGRTR